MTFYCLKLLKRADNHANLDSKFARIDSALHDIDITYGYEEEELDEDIDLVRHENKSKEPKVEENVIKLEQPSQPIQRNVEDQDFIPTIMSIQYRQPEDIVHAIESFVIDYGKNHATATDISKDVSDVPIECRRCNSVDMIQTEQIMDMSTWRNNLMASYRLKAEKNKRKQQRKDARRDDYLSVEVGNEKIEELTLPDELPGYRSGINYFES